MKLKVYQNDSIGDECCPVCGSEFPAPFSLTACSTCGFISFGCNMCPLDYNRRKHPDLTAVCEGKACPVYHPVTNLYAIYSKRVWDMLPEEYKGHVTAKPRSYIHLLLQDRVVPIYTSRHVYGITTIDMLKWNNGDKDIKGVPTILNIMGDEQF